MILVLFALTIQEVQFKQKKQPFETKLSMELSTGETNTSKSELINGLNEIAERYQKPIVKVVIGKTDFENQQDILWFGKNKPQGGNILLDGNQIQWLAKDMSGQLISSFDMGEKPISGTYAIPRDSKLREELTRWANENQLSLQFYESKPFLKSTYASLFLNPIGNALVALLILLCSVILSYYLLEAKNRAIKLLAGVKLSKIIWQDIRYILVNIIMGMAAGGILGSLYVGFDRGFNQLSLLILPIFIKVLIILFVLMAVSIGIGQFVKPKASHMANREIPLQKFKWTSFAVKSIAIFFTMLIIPMTVSSAMITSKIAKEYALWETMQNTYRLSFGTLDELYKEDNLNEVDQFLNKVDRLGGLKISLAIDRSIEISNEMKNSGFDHLVLTDKSWVEAMHVGIGENKENGKLTAISYEDIPRALGQFLEAQMPLLMRDETQSVQSLNYYIFSGRTFLALGPNTGEMDATLQCENPLVIVVEDPIQTLKTTGFLIPTLSSGNIIFSDKAILEQALEKTVIKTLILSIDGIADLALQTANDFREHLAHYIVASIILFATIIFSGAVSAQVWANENKKKVFLLYTYGQSYHRITQYPWKQDSKITSVVILISAGISFFFRRMELSIIAGVALSALVLYALVLKLFFRIDAQKSFEAGVRRAAS